MAHATFDPSGAAIDARFAVPDAASVDDVARAAVAATAHGQARARAGAWDEAAAALRASVALRERLVRAEAAGPAVTARGWFELSVACLALGHDDAARTLLGRARTAVALAEPGPATDGLRDLVDDTWARIAALDAPDAAAASAGATIGAHGAGGLLLDDALATVMGTSTATAAPPAPPARSLAGTAALGAPWVDAPGGHDVDDAPPRQATPETALQVIAPARPVPMPDLADTPAEFADDLPAPDETALTFLATAPSAPAATGRHTRDASLELDDELPTFDPWGQGAGPSVGDDEIVFLSPTSARPGDEPVTGGGAQHPPAEAALAAASRPRAHVVLPEFPPEAGAERKGLLSRLLRRGGR